MLLCRSPNSGSAALKARLGYRRHLSRKPLSGTLLKVQKSVSAYASFVDAPQRHRYSFAMNQERDAIGDAGKRISLGQIGCVILVLVLAFLLFEPLRFLLGYFFGEKSFG